MTVSVICGFDEAGRGPMAGPVYAAAVILCHNHPSGTLTPSQEDIAATRQLLSASEHLGIQILDHIIVSTNGYYSFVEQGLLFET